MENEAQNIDKLEFINESLATAVAEAAVQEYRPMRYSGLTERRCYRNYDRTIGLNKTWNQVLRIIVCFTYPFADLTVLPIIYFGESYGLKLACALLIEH